MGVLTVVGGSRPSALSNVRQLELRGPGRYGAQTRILVSHGETHYALHLSYSTPWKFRNSSGQSSRRLIARLSTRL